MRRKLTIAFLASMMLLGFWQMSADVSAQQKLTLGMILTGLQTKGKTPETATLEKRNVFITRRVQTNGVTFRLTPEIESELRNAGATTALINAIRVNGPASVTTPTPSGRPAATYKNLWVDYGVTENNQLGMRIHVAFTALRMKNIPGYLAIYFLDENGNPLKDNNNKFNSTSGDVAVYREITPAYDPANYDDYTVFMPYSELDLPNGNWNLRMDVKIIYKAGGLIQDLTKKDFNYKKGNDTSGINAVVKRVWIDYNITEEGRRGMRIHVNFEVTGLQGVSSYLVARVMKSNGTFLMSDSLDYSNNDGQLQTSFTMKPGYATTVYKDADMFLPYDEINVTKGKWPLTLDFDLTYEDGTLIKHITTYDFEFERR